MTDTRNWGNIILKSIDELDYSKIKDREAYVSAVIKAMAFLDYGYLLMLFESILVVKEEPEEKLEAKMK